MSREALQEEELLKTISRRYQAPSVNLYHIEIHRVNMSIIPAEAARKHRVLPLARTGTVLTVAMIDPTNVPAMDDIARITGCTIEPVVASVRALKEAIRHYYGPVPQSRFPRKSQEEDLLAALSRKYGVPYVDLSCYEIEPAIIKKVSAEMARRYQVLPLSRFGSTLTIAMADPTDVFGMDDIGYMAGCTAEPFVASERALNEGIDLYYPLRPSLHRVEQKLSPDDSLSPQAVRVHQVLLEQIRVSPRQLEKALSRQKLVGGSLGHTFVSLGFVTEEEITSLLSISYGVPSIRLDHLEVDPAIIRTIPCEVAWKHQVLPLACSGATLTIATADPSNVPAMDEVARMTGYNIERLVASEDDLMHAIDRYYGPPRPS